MIPVITIDGTSGTGKGTLSQALAMRLNWHWLDSGAIYRTIAWAALHHDVPVDDPEKLGVMIEAVSFEVGSRAEPGGIATYAYCDGNSLGDAIRSEECSKAASFVAALPVVRRAVFAMQRESRQVPGLVADGRDMGTVVFPDAPLKFFLSASAEERAQRRYNQLQERGEHGSLRAVLEDIQARDQRDRERDISPLKPAEDAVLLDTAGKPIPTVLSEAWLHALRVFPNLADSS